MPEPIQVIPRGEDVADIFERVRLATVAFGIVQPGNALTIVGSGVSVDPSGIIVTAGHVLDELDAGVRRWARRGGQAEAKVTIFRLAQAGVHPQSKRPGVELTLEHGPLRFASISDSTDLGIVRIVPNEPLPILPIDYDRNYREGDPVATCGFPYGVNLHERRTIISSFLTGIISAVVPHPALPVEARIHYQLQLPVSPGNSGGPVFDPETGCLLGVISRRYEPGGIPAGLCIAEPIHRARQAIDAVKDQPIPAPNAATTEPSTGESGT